MNRIYVYPWDQLSEGAGAIAEALDTQKLLRKGSKYKPQKGDVIVNWGASDIAPWIDKHAKGAYIRIVNPDVKGAIDKLTFFKRTADNPFVPDYRLTQAAAERMAFPVVCRTKLKGHDGDGIVIADSKAQLVDAPLYVEFQKQTAEYRIHVGRDKDGGTSIIGAQRKFKPKGFVGADDERIRVGRNGCYFVWTVNGEEVKNTLPERVTKAALSVFEMFPELDFGGLDVIYSNRGNIANGGQAYVLEINSAPEQTERSAKMYAEFFQQFRQADRLMAVVEPKDVAFQIEPDMDAFMEWFFDPNEIRNKDMIEFAKSCFLAGWKARKLCEYQRIYGEVVGDGERIDVV